jgi:SAM-dependent methyltransferase
MKFGPATFGELNAEDYDALHDPGTTDEAVAFIAEVAAGGRTLELAIGTGRIALPLAAQGLDIHGIEGSPEMVAKLREKPGGDAIPVVIGDFADVDVEGPFDHVFLVFNTLFNLASQEHQVRCFQNVSKCLRDGGTFLVETFVPDVTRFRNGQDVRTMQVGFNSVWLEATVHDPVRQVVEHQRVRISKDGMRLVPLPMRYAWPAEIDLMAQIAGMRLKDRWGGWHRQPFTADSKMHVSVYEKVAPAA